MRPRSTLLAITVYIGLLSACGSRSGLRLDEYDPVMGYPWHSAGTSGTGGSGGAAGTGGTAGAGGTSGTGGTAGTGGTGGSLPCEDGATQPCGTDVGACIPGQQTCENGAFGPCLDAVGPVDEVCNGVDDNCDGTIDDGFHIGEACQGTGTDKCFDGVMTCEGCVKTGPDKVEICNGIDDNCNGTIDADCEAGDCNPTLLVTGSTPSNPACIDFPVEAGSDGAIEYPCAGGPVTATLGGIAFSGSVTNNFVTLDAIVTIFPGQTPDGCTWQNHHHIEGSIPTGALTYSYSEAIIVNPPGVQCWQPCTESGTVKIQWLAVP